MKSYSEMNITFFFWGGGCHIYNIFAFHINCCLFFFFLGGGVVLVLCPCESHVSEVQCCVILVLSTVVNVLM